MKNLTLFLLITTFSTSLLYGQSDYKCNCKLVYGSKWEPKQITYFNDSLVIVEDANYISDSIRNLYNNEANFEELYKKIKFNWEQCSDTFLILNNVIGSRIGNYFYPYFPTDTMKIGEKFVRFSKYKYDGNYNIDAGVFYKMGDSILGSNKIAYFDFGVPELIIKTSINEIIKRDLNSLPFEKFATSNTFDSQDFFSGEAHCDSPDPNDPDCTFCLYTRFRIGDTPYKKEKEYNLIFLEGDCGKFLKGKPTFVKGN